jgi:hypothetical protein
MARKKLTPEQAKALLMADGMDFTEDFHALGSSAVGRLAEVAKLAGYRKGKNAPGSTVRMFYQYLSRVEPVVHAPGQLTQAERRAYQARARNKKTAGASQHATMKKSPSQLDREIAESLSGASTLKPDLKIGDVVQFRSEPGTGGVIRRFDDDRSWARVATPRGERKVPADALVLVRKEHELRVRRAVGVAKPSHATKRIPKTTLLWVVQGNYGYGHGWEDVTAEENWKEAKARIREYRENERGVPFRVIRRRERIAA